MSRRELIDLIVSARTVAGLTQAQLAAQLKISSQQVSRWERGTAVPGAKVLPRLAGALGIPEQELYMAAIAASQQETKQVRREANDVIAKVEMFVATYESFHAAYEQIGERVDQLVEEVGTIGKVVEEIRRVLDQPPRRPGRT